MHPQYSSEPEPDFLARRAAAFQAWYENMPLRAESLPRNGSIQIYRTLPYGALVQFTVVDTRQFRTRQPCGDNLKPSCDARLDSGATMMGAAQEAWFAESMRSSHARWNVVANQVMISQLRVPAADGPVAFNMDQWDGYTAARQRRMDTLATAKPNNPVFVTGDFHQTCVGNLQRDPNDKSSPTLATELVGTSITSGGDGALLGPGMEADIAANPNLLYNNDRRGYILCEATPDQMHSEVWTFEAVSHPGRPPQKAATFVSKSGTPGVLQTS
jgi:alkaline phosphatase D